MAASQTEPNESQVRSRPALQFEPWRMGFAERPYDPAMQPEQTTILIQRYLDRIAGDAHAETLVRERLAQAVQRLHRLCSNLIYFNHLDKGGHFAAWEEPALFVQEVRAAFKTLR